MLLREHATLDKLIGDAIMMYFGDPIPDAGHAAHACRGALAMQREMTALNARWTAGLPQLRTRIGVNTGPAIAGNMGTDTIFNYTILGDTVNLASRLEGVNNEYGTLIIGEETRRRIGDAFDVRELDWIRVKGKTQPAAIYELCGEAGSLTAAARERHARYAEGLRLYRLGDWDAAGAAFAASATDTAADVVGRVMADRCRTLAKDPPAAWDGVHVMRSK